MTENSLENFWSERLSDKEPKASFPISYCVSELYKNRSKFAKIGTKDDLLEKNAFSEPVFCQKNQQVPYYNMQEARKHKTKKVTIIT